ALAEDGNARAVRLVTMLERPEETLNVVLLVVLVTQLGTASLVGVLVDRFFGPYGVVVGVMVNIVAFFVLGAVAAKTYAIQHTDRAALRVANLLWFLTRFAPLRQLSRGLIGIANLILPGKGLKRGPFVTEAELRQMADVAAEEESIETEERELIHS